MACQYSSEQLHQGSSMGRVRDLDPCRTPQIPEMYKVWLKRPTVSERFLSSNYYKLCGIIKRMRIILSRYFL